MQLGSTDARIFRAGPEGLYGWGLGQSPQGPRSKFKDINECSIIVLKYVKAKLIYVVNN